MTLPIQARPCHFRMPGARILLAFLLLSLSAPAWTEVIGVYRDWVAVTVSDGSKRTCMVWSQPKKSDGFAGKRNDAFAFVTHLPREKRLNRVSFEAGFPLSADVTVTVDDQRFTLSASGTGAWTRNQSDDLAMISAMRAGASMTVEIKSANGDVVRDRYSLYGFTAAYTAINAACEVG
ncbi:MAG: invasion associated locus B family protein [Gammaproteobacteria bacterium]|nr:invasion associated locus B family protein [Gammaproteobacteria bacterium]